MKGLLPSHSIRGSVDQLRSEVYLQYFTATFVPRQSDICGEKVYPRRIKTERAGGLNRNGRVIRM